MKRHDLSSASRHMPKALLTTVSSDSHSWNLIFMELFMAERGFDVTNLGPCCPTDLTVSRAQETVFDVIIISSINGHTVIEGPEILAALRAGGVVAPVAIGGKLDTGADAHGADGLLDAGFDGVFPDTRSTLFEDFTAFLDGLPSRCVSACGACKTCKKTSAAASFMEIAAE